MWQILFKFILSLSLIFGITACSASPQQSEATRTVKHAMGESQVPEHPKRIVVLTSEGTEALLALGIKPVGAVQPYNGNPWYPHTEAELKGVKIVGNEQNPSIDAIISLKPDLIIGNKMRQEKIYSQLQKIAPTVFSEDLRGNWKKNFMLYAEAVNQVEKGKQILAQFDQKVEQVRKNAGDLLNQEVSVVRFLPGAVRIYHLDSFTGVIFKQIGFKRPAAQNKEDFAQVITREQIPQADGDILFYFTYNTENDKGGSKLEQEFTNDPLWKNLKAVKNHRAYKVDDIIWNTAGGVKAANIMLDQLNEIINQIKKEQG